MNDNPEYKSAKAYPVSKSSISAPEEVVILPQATTRLFPEPAERRRVSWPGRSPRNRLSARLREAIGTAPTDPLSTLETLIAEGDLHAFDLRMLSRWWGRAYYLLGLPAAVLAAVAGATALISVSGRIPAAIIALVSAGLTAAATFLNSEQNRKKDDELSAAWQGLADDARLTILKYAQKEKNSTQEAPDLQYWDDVLKLHRRKGRLLRGDLSQSDVSSESKASSL